MQKTVIDSGKNITPISEWYAYRELFWMLAWRDFRVRYAQTALGVFWAILRPALSLLVFILVFSVAAKIETPIAYPLFALSGMLVWNYFASVMSSAGSALIGAQSMVKKIYFPRIVLPASKAISGLADFFIVLVFLGALMFFYPTSLQATLLFLPLFLLLTLIAALTVGIWIAALSIRYRDFQHVLPFISQIGLYASPVAYPSTIIPEKYLWLYFLNPMAGLIEGFRWSLFGTPFPIYYSIISFMLLGVFFVGGLFYFQKTERTMADWI
jgi:lipopolysaccharide transport system permease protein